MTAPQRKTVSRHHLRLRACCPAEAGQAPEGLSRSAGKPLAALMVLAATLAGCTSYFEIPIETPIQPKLDVASFQRVLVAGFIGAGV